MAKLVFAVAEVGRTLFFPFFFTAHTPLWAIQGSDASCAAASRCFSQPALLPHMYAETRKACMQNADGAASLS